LSIIRNTLADPLKGGDEPLGSGPRRTRRSALAPAIDTKEEKVLEREAREREKKEEQERDREMEYERALRQRQAIGLPPGRRSHESQESISVSRVVLDRDFSRDSEPSKSVTEGIALGLFPFASTPRQSAAGFPEGAFGFPSPLLTPRDGAKRIPSAPFHG